MINNSIPQEIEFTLTDKVYKRYDRALAAEVLNKLNVSQNSLLFNFYINYEGPFWSEFLGYELLDVYEVIENIEAATSTCRDSFGFLESYLVISQISSGQVLVWEAGTDMVYEVDFEGGEKLLLSGRVSPGWNSFREFLRGYFLGN